MINLIFFFFCCRFYSKIAMSICVILVDANKAYLILLLLCGSMSFIGIVPLTCDLLLKLRSFHFHIQWHVSGTSDVDRQREKDPVDKRCRCTQHTTSLKKELHWRLLTEFWTNTLGLRFNWMISFRELWPILCSHWHWAQLQCEDDYRPTGNNCFTSSAITTLKRRRKKNVAKHQQWALNMFM